MERGRILTWVLLVVVLAASATHAGTCTERISPEQGARFVGDMNGAQQLFSADFDGDGDDDVVAAGTGGVAWFEREDDGQWTEHVIDNTNVAAGVFAADLNGDGHLDIVAAIDDPSDKVVWYHNRGLPDNSMRFDGTQQRVVDDTTINAPREVHGGDFDDDGDIDLVVAESGANQLVWYENTNGHGSFGAKITIAPVTGMMSVWVDNFDGDSDLDILACGISADVRWYTNTGNASPASRFDGTNVLVDNGGGSAHCRSADVNADADIDVVFTRSDQVHWVPGTGPGTFGAVQVAGSLDDARSVLPLDVDGDNDDDLVVSSGSAGVDGAVVLFENTGGSFAAGVTLVDGTSVALGLCGGDFDGDGDLDAAAALFTDNAVVWFDNVDGNMAINEADVVASSVAARGVVLHDMDGDLDLDLVVAGGTSNVLRWYENTDGLGGYDSGHDISAALTTPWGLFVADLDGDGDADVVTAAAGSGIVAWFVNTGDSNPALRMETTARELATGATNTNSVSGGDLAGNSRVDLVASVRGTGEVLWFENTNNADPDLRFAAGQTVGSSLSTPSHVLVVNMDGDADDDVLVVLEGSDSLVWFSNTDGAGSWSGANPIGTGSMSLPVTLAVGDFDGVDGVDVVVGAHTDGAVRVFLGTNGNGAFDTGTTISSDCKGARRVLVGDADDDGDLDILCASETTNSVLFFPNDGSANFKKRFIVSDVSGPYDCVGGDVDGDGDLDLIVAATGASEVVYVPTTQVVSGLDGVCELGEENGLCAPDCDATCDLVDSVFSTDCNTLCNGDGVCGASEAATGACVLDCDGVCDLNDDASSVDCSADAGSGSVSVQGLVHGAGSESTVRMLGTPVMEDTWARFTTQEYGEFGADARWRSHTIVRAEPRTGCVDSADLDGDGDVDVLAGTADGSVVWWENIGNSGAWSPPRTLATGSVWILRPAVDVDEVVAADVDNDGDVDVLSVVDGGTEPQVVRYHENLGRGVFAPPVVVTSAMEDAAPIAVVDWDDDGDLDVVVSRLENSDGSLVVVEFDDTIGAYTTLHTLVGSGEDAHYVLAGLIDDDLLPDIIVLTPTDVAWYSNTGSWTVGSRTPLPTAPSSANVAVLGDFKAGGGIDLAIGSGGGGENVIMYTNDGLGTWTRETNWDSGVPVSDIRGLAAADVDRDGYVDLLVSSFGGDEVMWYASAGDGTTSGSTSIASGTDVTDISRVSMADVDGDGDVDAIAVGVLGSVAPLLWENADSYGSFGATGTLAPRVHENSELAKLADMDGDGDLDVVVVEVVSTTLRVTVWMNAARGEYFMPFDVPNVPGGMVASDVALGDVDNDGFVDIVVSDTASTGEVHLWLNDGSGRFAGVSPSSHSTLGARSSILLVDANGDNDLDLIACDGSAVGVFQYDVGSFSSVGSITTDLLSPGRVRAAHLNGDSRVDLIVIGNGRLHMCTGSGGHGFAAPVSLVPNDQFTIFDAETGDVDNDGDVDVVVSTGIGVFWLENDGAGSFERHTAEYVLSGVPARHVRLADVDDDGDLDVVLKETVDSDVLASSVLRNLDGRGRDWSDAVAFLNYHYDTFSAKDGVHFEMGDIDGDGDDDAVRLVSDPSIVEWFENEGAVRQPEAMQVLHFGVDVASFVGSGDVNGDTHMDVLVGSYEDGTLGWFAGDSTGAFGAEHVISFFFPTDSAALADWDEDGDLDVFAVSDDLHIIAWFENVNGDGHTWNKHIIDDITALDAITVVAADVDFDGHIDAVVAFRDTDRVALYPGDPEGPLPFFEAPVELCDDCVSVEYIAVADVNSDNQLDVMASADGDLFFILNQGSRTFAPRVSIENTVVCEGVAMGDIDGDTKVDVVVGDGDGGVFWVPGDNLGGWGTPVVIPTCTGIGGVGGVALFDADGDNDLDLAVGCIDSEQVLVLRNNGAAVFSEETVVVPSTKMAEPWFLHTADLNKDGREDILFADSGDGAVGWVPNEAGYVFGQHALIAGISFSNSDENWAKFLDFDEDGDLDVILMNKGSETVQWMENDGTGTFSSGIVISAWDADASRSLKLYDLDGDGDKDLLFDDTQSPDSVRWIENTGGATLGSSVEIMSGLTSPYYVKAADIDGDGDLDVFTADAEDVILIALNEGDGTFDTPSVYFDPAWNVGRFELMDVDTDGAVDLVVHDLTNDKLWWARNLDDGLGTLDSATDLLVGEVPFVADDVLESGDIDADGDMDLIFDVISHAGMWWAENDGSGSFTLHRFASEQVHVRKAQLVDLDNDNDLDIVIGAANSDMFTAALWCSFDSARGNFDAPRLVAHLGKPMIGDALHVVTTGDVDGDGDLDVMMAGDYGVAVFKSAVASGQTAAYAQLDGDLKAHVTLPKAGTYDVAYRSPGQTAFTSVPGAQVVAAPADCPVGSFVDAYTPGAVACHTCAHGYVSTHINSDVCERQSVWFVGLPTQLENGDAAPSVMVLGARAGAGVRAYLTVQPDCTQTLQHLPFIDLTSSVVSGPVNKPLLSGSFRMCLNRDGSGHFEEQLHVSFVVPCKTGATTSCADQNAIDALLMQSSGAAVDSWNDADACNAPWSGVTCDTGRITHLILDSVDLAVVDFPCPLFRQLTALVDLRFNNVGLNVDLTTMACLPTSLERLALSGAGVTGQLPSEWGDMHGMVDFNANANPGLTTTLPESWGEGWPLVDSISIVPGGQTDGVITGVIPESWEKMEALRNINLSGSSLTSPLPDMSKWTKLQSIDLGYGYWDEPFPDLSKWKYLTALNLYHPRGGGAFTGTLPDMITTDLRTVVIPDNALSGTIPASWAAAMHSDFYALRVSNCGLEGELPDLSLNVNPYRLDVVSLAGNSFTTNWFNDMNAFWLDVDDERQGNSVVGQQGTTIDFGLPGNTIYCDYGTNTVYAVIKGDTNDCVCPPTFVATPPTCDTCLDGYYGEACEACPGVEDGNECFGHGACLDGAANSGACPDVLDDVFPKAFDSVASTHVVTFVGGVAAAPGPHVHVVLTPAADCSGEPLGVAGVLTEATIELSGRFRDMAQYRVCVSTQSGDAGTFMDADIAFTPLLIADVSPPDSEFVHAWLIEVYDDKEGDGEVLYDRQGTTLVHTNNIDQVWGADHPTFGTVTTDTWSLRLSGRLTMPFFGASENWDLRLICDGAVRVFLDGVLASPVGAWDTPSETVRNVDIAAAIQVTGPGHVAEVVVEYVHATGDNAALTAQWRGTTVASFEYIPIDYVVQPYGRAVSFDGLNNDYLAEAGRTVLPAQAWTLTAWVRPHSGASTDGTLVSIRDDTSPGLMLAVQLFTNDDTRGITLTLRDYTLHTGVGLRDNTWSHVGVSVYHPSSLVTVYVDGYARFSRVWDDIFGMSSEVSENSHMRVGALLSADYPSTATDAAGALDADVYDLALWDNAHEETVRRARHALTPDGVGAVWSYRFPEERHAYGPMGTLFPMTQFDGFDFALQHVGPGELATVVPPLLPAIDNVMHLSGDTNSLVQVRQPTGIDFRGGAAVMVRVRVDKPLGYPASVLHVHRSAGTVQTSLLELAIDVDADEVHFGVSGVVKTFTLSGLATGDWITLMCTFEHIPGSDSTFDCGKVDSTSQESGVQATENAMSLPSVPTTDQFALTLGHRPMRLWSFARPQRALVGALDSVRVWNRHVPLGTLLADRCGAGSDVPRGGALVAHYEFGGSDDATVMRDLSLHGNDLQRYTTPELRDDRPLDATFVCGTFASNCYFSSMIGTRRMVADVGFSSMTSFTVSFWARIEQRTSASKLVLFRVAVTPDDYFTVNVGTTGAIGVFFSSGAEVANMGTTWDDGEWWHTTISWESSGVANNLLLWQTDEDGTTTSSSATLSESYTFPSASPESLPVITIGQEPLAPGVLPGHYHLDELRVWADTLLDGSTQLAFLACNQGTVAAPDLWYRFDECGIPDRVENAGELGSALEMWDTGVVGTAVVPENAGDPALNEGGALRLSASGGHVVRGLYKPVNFYRDGAFSWSSWVYVRFISGGESEFTLWHWKSEDSVSDMRIWIDDSGALHAKVAGASTNWAVGGWAGEWRHVALTHDGANTLTLYMDGTVHGAPDTSFSPVSLPDAPNANDNYLVLGTKLSARTDISPTSGALLVGGGVADGAGGNGYLDAVRFWNVALTAPQVDADRTERASPAQPANLLVWWSFDDVATADVTAAIPDLASGTGNTYPLLALSHALTPTTVPEAVARPPSDLAGRALAAGRTERAGLLYREQCHDDTCDGSHAGCCAVDTCGDGGRCVDARCRCPVCTYGPQCGAVDWACAAEVMVRATPATLISDGEDEYVHFDFDPAPTQLTATKAVPFVLASVGDVCDDLVDGMRDATVFHVVDDIAIAIPFVHNQGAVVLVDVLFSTTANVVHIAEHDTPGGRTSSASTEIVATFGGDTVLGLYAVDWDLDGDSDIALNVGGTTDSFSLVDNTGVDWTTIIAIASSAVDADTIAFGDLDGDGFPDAVWMVSGELRARLNNGAGGVVAGINVLGALSPASAVIVAPIMGHGYGDVLHVDASAEIRVLQSDGTPARDFTQLTSALWTVTNANGVDGAVSSGALFDVAHLNGDRHVDIVALDGGEVTIMVSDGGYTAASFAATGGFGTATVTSSGGEYVECYVLRNMGGPNYDELACRRELANTYSSLVILRPDTNDLLLGSWSEDVVVGSIGPLLTVEAVDMDGDAGLDIFLATQDGAVAVLFHEYVLERDGLEPVESWTATPEVGMGTRVRGVPALVGESGDTVESLQVCMSPTHGRDWFSQTGVDLFTVTEDRRVLAMDPSRVEKNTAVTFSSDTVGAFGGDAEGNVERRVSFVPAGLPCAARSVSVLGMSGTLSGLTASPLMVELAVSQSGSRDLFTSNGVDTVKVSYFDGSSHAAASSLALTVSPTAIHAIAAVEGDGNERAPTLLIAHTESGNEYVHRVRFSQVDAAIVSQVQLSLGSDVYDSMTSWEGRVFVGSSGSSVVSELEAPDYESAVELANSVSLTGAGVVAYDLDDNGVPEVWYGEGDSLCHVGADFLVSGCIDTGTGGVAAIAFGDMDGDGADDVVVSKGTAVVYLRHTGALALDAAVEVVNTVAPAARSLVVMDVDGNGVADVMFGDSGTTDVEVYMGDGVGGWGTLANPTFGSTPGALVLSRNAAGRPYLLVSVGSQVDVYHVSVDALNVDDFVASALFSSATPSTGTLPDTGGVDYGVCVSADEGYTWVLQSAVSLHAYDVTDVVTGISPSSFEAGDTPWITLTDAYADEQTRFAFVEDGVSCGAAVEFVARSTLFTVPSGGIMGLAVGNVDNANGVDIVTMGGDTGGIVGYLAEQGDGTYVGTSMLSYAKSGIVDIQVADMTADGTLDVAYASSTTNRVGYLRADDGTGTLWSDVVVVDVSISSLNVPVALVVGSVFNAHPDMIVADADGVLVVENKGSGVFERATRISTHAGITDVAVGDMDSAVGLDVAFVLRTGEVFVLEKTGDRTFDEHEVASGLGKPVHVEIADIDSANGLDLVVLEESTNRVSLLVDTGSGWDFEYHLIDGSVERPSWMFVGQVDGLGGVDVVVAMENEPYARLFRNDGPDASVSMPVGWGRVDVDIGGPASHVTAVAGVGIVAALYDGTIVGVAASPLYEGLTTYDEAAVALAAPITVGHNTVMDLCYSEDGGTTFTRQTSPSVIVTALDGGSAPVFGDPHFGGFHGGWFDFYGAPGKVYNLLSDTHVQLNARFVDISDIGELSGHYMSEFGLKLGEHTRVHYHRNGNVTITPLVRDGPRRALIDGGAGAIEWTGQDLRIRYDVYRIDLRRFAGHSAAVAHDVDTHHVAYRLWYDRERLEDEGRWDTWAPHGVHGQTSRSEGVVVGRGQQGEGVIEGAPDDYVVRDGLFGDDFAFNRFAPRSRVAVPARPMDAFRDSVSAYGV